MLNLGVWHKMPLGQKELLLTDGLAELEGQTPIGGQIPPILSSGIWSFVLKFLKYSYLHHYTQGLVGTLREEPQHAVPTDDCQRCSSKVVVPLEK